MKKFLMFFKSDIYAYSLQIPTTLSHDCERIE